MSYYRRGRDQGGVGTGFRLGRSTALVRVVGDEGRRRRGGAAGAALVRAEVRLAVGLGPDHELLLGGGDVGIRALPGLEDGLLERAAVGEGQGPGLFARADVHRLERERRVLLGC